MSPRLIYSLNIDCILRMRRNIGNLQKQMNEMERRMIDRKQKLHLPLVILVKNIVILGLVQSELTITCRFDIKIRIFYNG